MARVADFPGHAASFGSAGPAAPAGPEPRRGTVFWDLENCPCGAQTRGYEVVRRIKDLARDRNVVLTNIIIIANLDRVPASIKLELEESGVVLCSVSSGKPSASDIAILGEMLKLVYFWRSPHTIFLISGDRDFSKILNFLEFAHYDVVLIHPAKVSPVLIHAVREHMLWSDLLVERTPPSSTPVLVPPTPPPGDRLRTDALSLPATPSPAFFQQQFLQTPAPPAPAALVESSTEAADPVFEYSDLSFSPSSPDAPSAQPADASPSAADLPASPIPPPEKLVPLLRELRRLGQSGKAPFVRTALLHSACRRCGLDPEPCLDLAVRTGLVHWDPQADACCLSEAGNLVLAANAQRRAADVAAVVPLLEAFETAYWPVLRKLADWSLSFANSGEKLKLRKLAASLEIESHQLGFESAYSYLESARARGAVLLEPADLPPLDRTSQFSPRTLDAAVRLPDARSSLLRPRGVPEKWLPLVRMLVSLSATGTGVPLRAVEAALRAPEFAGWKHGFARPGAMLEAAEAAGVAAIARNGPAWTVSLRLADPAVAASYTAEMEATRARSLQAAGKVKGKKKKAGQVAWLDPGGQGAAAEEPGEGAGGVAAAAKADEDGSADETLVTADEQAGGAAPESAQEAEQEPEPEPEPEAVAQEPVDAGPAAPSPTAEPEASLAPPSAPSLLPSPDPENFPPPTPPNTPVDMPDGSGPSRSRGAVSWGELARATAVASVERSAHDADQAAVEVNGEREGAGQVQAEERGSEMGAEAGSGPAEGAEETDGGRSDGDAQPAEPGASQEGEEAGEETGIGEAGSPADGKVEEGEGAEAAEVALAVDSPQEGTDAEAGAAAEDSDPAPDLPTEDAAPEQPPAAEDDPLDRLPRLAPIDPIPSPRTPPAAAFPPSATPAASSAEQEPAIADGLAAPEPAPAERKRGWFGAISDALFG